MGKAYRWLINAASTSRKGIEDVIVSIIPQAFSLLCGFVTLVMIARALGPAGLGQYALIVSVATLAAALSDVGIGQTAIRFASRAVTLGEIGNQYAVLRWAFRLRMALVLAITFIIFLMIPALTQKWHTQDLNFLMRVSLCLSVFYAVASVPMIYFQSLQRFRVNTLVSVGQSFISLAGILIIAWLDYWSLNLVIAVGVVSSALGALLFLAMVPGDAIISFRELGHLVSLGLKGLWQIPQEVDVAEKSEVSTLGSFAFYMVLSSIATILMLRADLWLMGIYLDKSQIGLYNVETRFSLVLSMVLGAINTALWPRASALETVESIKGLLKRTFIFSIPITAVCTLYAIFVPLLTPWLFGHSYAEGIFVGQLLCLRYCLAILICPLGVIGYSFGMVRIYWIINLIQLIVVVSMCIVLLPRIGMVGAALALIANELISISVVGTIMWRKMATGDLQPS